MKRFASALVALLVTLSGVWFGIRHLYRDVELRRELLAKTEKHALALGNKLLFFPAARPEARAYAHVAADLTPILRGLHSPTVLAILPAPFGVPVVGERNGQLSRIDRRGIVVRWLDLEVSAQGPADGLLSVAFHPLFAENGRMFLAFTREAEGRSQLHVSEYVVPEPKTALEETPSFVADLLVLDRQAAETGSCALAFDAGGLLFVALGEGLSAPGAPGLSRAILRLDVSGPSPSSEGKLALPYRVPTDNPFIGDAEVPPEVFATGLTDPAQLAVDPQSGLVLGERGKLGQQSLWLVGPRDHLGNGPQPAGCGDSKPCARPEPIFKYRGALGHELVGPALSGNVRPARLAAHAIFGDHGTGQLFAVPLRGNGRPLSLGSWPFRPRAFVREANGSVLVADEARGVIYRIGPSAMHWTDGFPAIFDAVEDAIGL